MERAGLRVACERERVRAHIARAERGARRRQVGLAALPGLNRALLLDELARYRRRGRFPINRDARRSLVPVFVDAWGTRCAVGHLMEVSGQGELVQHIAGTRNDARVGELAALPDVRAWLAAAGLSVEEAARIQPSYCFLTEAEACFCRDSGPDPVALGTIVTEGSPELVVRLERIDGNLPGARVGDEMPAHGPGQVGQQVLLRPVDPAGTLYVQAALSMQNGQVYCQVNPDTAKRPVTVDTAIEALRTEGDACIDVLANDESLWNRSQCEGGSGLDGIIGEDGGGGCGLVPAAGSVELTSATLLTALLAYRRRRQR